MILDKRHEVLVQLPGVDDDVLVADGLLIPEVSPGIGRATELVGDWWVDLHLLRLEELLVEVLEVDG